MVGPHESSAFCERIQQRLDAAQETMKQQRGAMDHVMVELEQRQATFRESADALMRNVLNGAWTGSSRAPTTLYMPRQTRSCHD
jgi:hypothetical protein